MCKYKNKTKHNIQHPIIILILIKNDNDASKYVDEESNNPNNLILHRGNNISIEPKQNKDYKSIDSYKPSGNLIYNQDLLKNIETKSRK